MCAVPRGTPTDPVGREKAGHPRRKAGAARHTKTGACSAKAAGGNSLVAKNHPDPKNGLRPRAWAEISPWRPPLPPAAGRNTPLHATRLRLPLAATESLLSHPAPLNEHWPRAWGNLVRTTIVVLTISLLRRGARGLEGTALRGQRSLRRTGGAARHPKAGVGSATSFDCPARAAAVEDQPKQRKPQ